MAPWLGEVQARAALLPWPARVLADVHDMATVMANTDLCIGAAGSTAWERCTLGVPSLLVVTAENQAGIAAALHESGAALSVGSSLTPTFAQSLQAGIARFATDAQALIAASAAAAAVTDGTGVDVVCRALLEDIEP